METFPNTSIMQTVSYLLKRPSMCNAVSVIALQQHSWALEVTQNIFYTCTVFSHAYT